ncbi:MAG: nucleoside deaminase [Erysipelotrichaceae bacterium]|nr:nucleoside deaminase [Erysipelotrichaceae bacterium]
MTRQDFMLEAIEEAKKGILSKEGGPFGAVVVKDGKIVGRGHNEVIKEQDPTCHGEVMAIHDACHHLGTFDLSGCDIYTTSYPCPMCLGAIMWANIGHVYYACNTIDAERIGFRDKQFYESQHGLVFRELERTEGQKLFAEYQKGDHKMY